MEWPCAAPVYLTKGYPDGRRATLERLVMGNNQASSEAQVLGRRRRATRVYQEGDIILVEEGGEAEQAVRMDRKRMKHGMTANSRSKGVEHRITPPFKSRRVQGILTSWGTGPGSVPEPVYHTHPLL